MLIIFLFIFLLNFFCFLFQEVVFIDFHMEEEGTRGWELRKKRKKKLFLALSPRPGPDGPNASGWYRRLRQPISPLSLLKCDQL